jgi:hypothetical protein
LVALPSPDGTQGGNWYFPARKVPCTVAGAVCPPSVCGGYTGAVDGVVQLLQGEGLSVDAVGRDNAAEFAHVLTRYVER